MMARIWHGYTTPADADVYELRAEILFFIAIRYCLRVYLKNVVPAFPL